MIKLVKNLKEVEKSKLALLKLAKLYPKEWCPCHFKVQKTTKNPY